MNHSGPPVRRKRPKFQFRMRDLLWGMTLLGAALGMLSASPRVFDLVGSLEIFTFDKVVLFIAYGLSIFACCGAGIGCLFRRPGRGAVVGLSIAVFAAFGLVLWFITHARSF